MQNVIKVQHGFHSHQIGSITVFTGKIRIKAHIAEVTHFLQNWENHIRFYSSREDQYTTMEYCVTDFILHCKLQNAINEETRRITINRINMKYDIKQNANPVMWRSVNPDDLPY